MSPPPPAQPPSNHLAGQHITVMGLGQFGGGIGVTRWLLEQGARITITDLRSETELQSSLAELSDCPARETLTLHLGGHAEQDFSNADLIIVNPAVPHPWDNRYLQCAADHGVPMTTEMRLLTERLDRARIIGVTGSAGKSTTAAMIHHILTSTGHTSHLGGNIGGSLLNALDQISPDDWIVLELSSAMLYWLGEGIGYPAAPGFSPHVAVLTNIEPNHLDWHGSFEHYRESKHNIFRDQSPGDHQITEDQFQQRRPLPLRIPGKHNQLNGLFAIAAALRAAKVLPQDAAAALADFTGLPHRLELIAEHGEQRFYNDSKSTVPQATVLAVQAFAKPSKIHLIVGGYDKGIDLAPIADLAPRIAKLYTIGTTGPTLADRAGRAHAVHCATLQQAVSAALNAMAADHILLLSPGCASWDQFEHYEQRGETFRTLVHTHLNQPSIR